MKSTFPRGRGAVLIALFLAGCSPAPEEPSRPPAKENKSVPVKGLPRTETPRQLRHRLLPRIVLGGTQDGLGDSLLELDPSLGIGVEPVLRKPGHNRRPSKEELTAILNLGEPLDLLYRRGLARLLETSTLKAVGGRFADEARMLDLDTSVPGTEACVLLPELWDQAVKTLEREVWLALPDRGHCRFLPAGPWRLVAGMVDDLALWNEGASEPLCGRFVYRDGNVLRGGPTFRSLMKEPGK